MSTDMVTIGTTLIQLATNFVAFFFAVFVALFCYKNGVTTSTNKYDVVTIGTTLNAIFCLLLLHLLHDSVLQLARRPIQKLILLLKEQMS